MTKMMTNMQATPPHISKFQQLLRELFQFDCADLDFGIYRIMNYKRDAIERFITEDLVQTVSDELDSGPLVQQIRAAQELEEAAHEVRETLGNYIDVQGNLDENYHGTTVGRKYLNAREKAAGGVKKRRLETGCQHTRNGIGERRTDRTRNGFICWNIIWPT